MSRRIAVVLFNLGGPDGPESVRPFLRNLFNDPAIIYAPWPVRPLIAELISRTRGPKAKLEYAKMGGGSPIIPETERQADALTAALKAASPDDEFACFLAMRYWHPFTESGHASARASPPRPRASRAHTPPGINRPSIRVKSPAESKGRSSKSTPRDGAAPQ